MAIKTYNLVPDLGKVRSTTSNSSYTSLHCTYNWSSRAQLILHTAILTAMQLPKGSVLKRFGWWAQNSGVYTSIMSLRIAFAHSTVTALTTTWLTAVLTYVIGTAATGYNIPMSSCYTPQYNSWPCTAFFTWNGSNGILIDMSRTGAAAAGGTTTGYWGVATAPGYGNIYHRVASNASTFPLTGTGAIAAHLPDLYLQWEFAEQGSFWLGISL